MVYNWLKRYMLVVVAIVIFFFGLHRFFAYRPGFIEQTASYATYPVLVIHSYINNKIKDYFKERTASSSLRATTQALEEQLIHAQSKIIALESQLNYAQETQEVRQFAQRYETDQAQLAHVLMRQLTDQQQCYLVDAGSNQGVTVDMVAVFKNCLLGRVSTVYPTYSKIQLITDIGCKVATFCGSTESQGIHEGCNNQHESALNFVSHLDTIKVDDLVISSGSGMVFPRGFLLGSIKQAHIDGLYYAITVIPPIDLNAVDYLYLIKK